MTIGIMTLVAGIAGDDRRHPDRFPHRVFRAATALAGIGFGAGFRGAIRCTVMPLADPTQHAGLLSAVFVVSYAGMGAPAVLALRPGQSRPEFDVSVGGLCGRSDRARPDRGGRARPPTRVKWDRGATVLNRSV